MFKKALATLITSLTILLVSSIASPQCPAFYTFDGDDSVKSVGQSVAVGDIDNDGQEDFIYGCPHLFSDTGYGYVVVVNDENNDTLMFLKGEFLDDFFGYSVASGDVNNDGYDDVIVGAYSLDSGGVPVNKGRVYAFSGQTGNEIFRFTGNSTYLNVGYSVSSGDVDGDGYDDIIVGAHVTNSSTGAVIIFSGQGDSVLNVYSGEATGDEFGYSVSSAGDVDSNGYEDIIVGARSSDSGGTLSGRAYVFSPQTGDTLHIFTGENGGDRFGYSVSRAGDVDNDGYDDLIVGAPFYNAGLGVEGRAYVFSGKTGVSLKTLTGEEVSDAFGIAVASAGDMDSDGYDDVLIGAWIAGPGSPGPGKFYAISVQTDSTLLTHTGVASGDGFGFAISNAGDVNDDGYPDVIVGSPSYGNDSGQAYVYFACGLRGDVNCDGNDGNILDLNFLINVIFRSGPLPACDIESDVNSDGNPHDILDLNYLINRIFRNGPAPGPCF